MRACKGWISGNTTVQQRQRPVSVSEPVNYHRSIKKGARLVPINFKNLVKYGKRPVQAPLTREFNTAPQRFFQHYHSYLL